MGDWFAAVIFIASGGHVVFLPLSFLIPRGLAQSPTSVADAVIAHSSDAAGRCLQAGSFALCRAPCHRSRNKEE
jgi:hypothetical protein